MPELIEIPEVPSSMVQDDFRRPFFAKADGNLDGM
jgi:hypothetical protein